MYIFPAIDIYNGKAIRLTKGDYSHQTVYSNAPEELVKRFADHGASWIHVVDLEGAKAHRVVNWNTIKSILSVGGVNVQLGGGIRTHEEVNRLLDLGVQRAVLGSLIHSDPNTVQQWISEWQPERFCIAVDLKKGLIVTNAWQSNEAINMSDVMNWLISMNIQYIMCTDVERDGTLEGANVPLYTDLSTRYPQCFWIASGGVKNIEDIHLLKQTNVYGVIVGKAIYEGTISLQELFAGS